MAEALQKLENTHFSLFLRERERRKFSLSQPAKLNAKIVANTYASKYVSFKCQDPFKSK